MQDQKMRPYLEHHKNQFLTAPEVKIFLKFYKNGWLI